MIAKLMMTMARMMMAMRRPPHNPILSSKFSGKIWHYMTLYSKKNESQYSDWGASGGPSNHKQGGFLNSQIAKTNFSPWWHAPPIPSVLAHPSSQISENIFNFSRGKGWVSNGCISTFHSSQNGTSRLWGNMGPIWDLGISTLCTSKMYNCVRDLKYTFSPKKTVTQIHGNLGKYCLTGPRLYGIIHHKIIKNKF